MKITFLQASPYDFKGGCWFYRVLMPYEALKARGHEVEMAVASPTVDEGLIRFPDVAVFRGTYSFDPINLIKRFKERDTRVVYDVDDDYLTVNPSNPFHSASQSVKNQYVNLIKMADVVTVTNKILKERIEKFNKNIVIVPNALNFLRFGERIGKNDKLKIGYTGASSHWEDIAIVIDVLADLQKKYDFEFYLQGMCGTPLIGEIYTYKVINRDGIEPEKRAYYKSAIDAYDKLKKMRYVHIPFYPPELYPEILRNLNFDIGIAPLKDNVFNRAKSPIKFYEYVATGTPCLASDVLPYKGVVKYTAKNTYKDWYKKLEKMIVSEKFREKLLDKQWGVVKKVADMADVVKIWEEAFSD